MERSVVALVPLDGYDCQALVDAAVQQGIALLGGIDCFVRPEDRILLKPNMLSAAPPYKAVTTHPAVFSAVAGLLHQSGFTHLSYGDSPGNPTATPRKVADASGIAQAGQAWNISPADFDHGVSIAFPQGEAAHSFCLCQGVVDADAVISLSKMKTHALERITGAVKNLYGCIYSVNKAAGHARHPSSDTFADMLCDLHRLVKPRLHIMDGVVAMEGNGPTSGIPVEMHVLLFSADPVALDSVFASLINLSPAAVPTCVSGAKHHLGVMEESAIVVRTPNGDMTLSKAAARYGKPEFDVYRGVMKKHLLSKLMPLLPFLQDRPQVDKHKCIACGICQESCPVPGKAVHSGHGQKAKYDYHHCIRCYCCQEMCPVKAISVHHPISRK